MAGKAGKRILILGGGFGGVYAAMTLQKLFRRHRDVEIALINQENYFVFQPMLAEVISGNIGILNTITPIRDLCRDVSLYVRKVESIDLERRVVLASHGFRPQSTAIPYDYLVIALGTLENFGVVRGLQEHGLHFKNLGDALVLRNRLIHILEEADIETDAALRRSMLTFVMAGGGFSGVEAIAELNDFVRGVARRYPHVRPEEPKVILLPTGPRILPELPESLSLYAQRLLRRRQVEIRLETRLGAVTAEEAILGDGTRIPTRTLIATIGATPNPVLLSLPMKRERGRIVVNEYLEVPEHPNVWALGDCAYIIDHKTGLPCPPTAQYAVREGRRVALNIQATMQGKERKPFSFSALGMMGSLGHQSAVGHVLGVRVSGLPAWLMWRAIYWAKLPGMTRKFRIGMDWFLSFVLPRELAQINVDPSDSMMREHFEAGEVVFHQGDLGDRMYIVIDGEVEVILTTAEQQTRILAKLSAGEWFGEMALFNDEPRGATVRTITNVNVLAIDRSAFKTLVTHVPPLRAIFEQIMEQRRAENEQKGRGEPDQAPVG